MLTKTIAHAGVAALLLAPVFAQSSILPYLPADTVMAVSVPDLPTSVREFAHMPLAKMWAEEEVQTFFADALRMAKQHIDQGLAQAREMHKAGQLPVDPDKLMNLRLNGGTFAVTRLAIAADGPHVHPRIGLVFQLDFGDSAEQWFGLVRTGLTMMEMQAKDRMVKAEGKVGDVTLLSFTPAEANGGEMGLNVAMVKSSLIVGTLKDDVRAVIENMAKGAPVLTATDRYKNCAKHLLTAGAECEMFVRVDPFIDFVIEGLRVAATLKQELQMVDVDGIGRAVAALGLRGIQAIGSTSTYQDGKCVHKSYTAAPAADRKGLLAGVGKKLDTSFFRWVPKDAVSFSATTMDAMGIYDGLVGALRAYDPKMAEQGLGKLAEVEQQLGFSIRDDLFGSIGDTLILWSMPMGTIMQAPELAILIKVNNQERIVKVMKSVAKLTEGKIEIEESEKRGVKAYSVKLNLDMPNGMGWNPLDSFSPTFAFKDGWLVSGFSAGDIKRAFQRMEREDDPKGDIRGNKEFAGCAGKLPPDLQAVSFTDWKASFESYYQLVTGVLPFLPVREEIPFDMSQLPEAATLTKHLFGSVSWSAVGADGFETTSISPFGPEVMLIAIPVGVAAGVAVYYFRTHF